MTSIERGPIAEMDLLDRFWDDLVGGLEGSIGNGGVGAQSDPPLAAIVRQLHTEDAEFAPPPGQRDRVWRELADLHSVTPRGVGAIALAPTSSPVGLGPGRGSRPISARAWRVRRLGTALESLVAAALILVLLGVYAVGNRAFNRPDPPPAAGVPMLQGNAARTGAMPGPGPGDAPAVRWRFRTGSWESTSSPVVADGVVYVGSTDKYLYAVDAATGTERWRFDTGGRVLGAPAIVGGVVFVGSGDVAGRPGAVYALDATTGAARWRFETPAGVGYASMILADGLVFVGGLNGDVYALAMADGTERWHATFPRLDIDSMAVADGLVYIGRPDGYVDALETATGRPRWSTLVAEDALFLAPSVVDGVVFVGVRSNAAVAGMGQLTVVAVGAEDGVERWRLYFPLTGFEIDMLSHFGGGPPAVVDGVVYVAQPDGRLAGVDAVTGASRWQSRTTGGGPFLASAPVVAGGIIYIGGFNGALYAVDGTTGAERWNLDIGGGTAGAISAVPAVIDGVVFVASDDGYLTAVADPVTPT